MEYSTTRGTSSDMDSFTWKPRETKIHFQLNELRHERTTYISHSKEHQTNPITHDYDQYLRRQWRGFGKEIQISQGKSKRGFLFEFDRDGVFPSGGRRRLRQFDVSGAEIALSGERHALLSAVHDHALADLTQIPANALKLGGRQPDDAIVFRFGDVQMFSVKVQLMDVVF